VLVLYTDGVTEAINEKQEQFGQERLIEVVEKGANLPAQELIGKLKEDVTVFTQGQPQFDDFTLVAVKAT